MVFNAQWVCRLTVSACVSIRQMTGVEFCYRFGYNFIWQRLSRTVRKYVRLKTLLTPVWLGQVKEVCVEHYYTTDPSSAHQYREIILDYNGRRLSFLTDSGVFSRKEIDFGTRLLIKSMPDLTGRMLDLGCGWGALSLPLAIRNPGLKVVCADVNERAVDLCRKNAERLGVSAEVCISDGFSNVSGQFDVIVTNPPIRAGKSVYYPWFGQAYQRLCQGGMFACVVQRKQGAPSVKKEIEKHFGICRILARDDGYWILSGTKA